MHFYDNDNFAGNEIENDLAALSDIDSITNPIRLVSKEFDY
jgi:hypothetical protein